MKKTEITEDEVTQIVAFDPEKMAKAIQMIADGARQILNAGGLRYETVVTLIHDVSKVPKKDIRLVLNNLTRFDDHLEKPRRVISKDSPLNELLKD